MWQASFQLGFVFITLSHTHTATASTTLSPQHRIYTLITTTLTGSIQPCFTTTTPTTSTTSLTQHSQPLQTFYHDNTHNLYHLVTMTTLSLHHLVIMIKPSTPTIWYNENIHSLYHLVTTTPKIFTSFFPWKHSQSTLSLPHSQSQPTYYHEKDSHSLPTSYHWDTHSLYHLVTMTIPTLSTSLLPRQHSQPLPSCYHDNGLNHQVTITPSTAAI